MTRLKKNFHLSKSALGALSPGVEVKVKDLVKHNEKKQYHYGELELDSEEEVWFCHWLDELKAHAYINHWKRITESIIVTNKQDLGFITSMSKRDGTYQLTRHGQSMLNAQYKPDFAIEWSRYAEGIFYLNGNAASNNAIHPLTYTKAQVQGAPFLAWSEVSIVDVKGEFIGPHNISALTFPLIRKFLWQDQQIFINKIIPVSLFKKTFVPLSLLKTKHGKSRKFSFSPIRTLEEFFTQTKPAGYFPDPL